MNKKRYIVKVTPLVPLTPKFVDVDTVNKGSAEWIALQKLKEQGVDVNYFTTIVTEVG